MISNMLNHHKSLLDQLWTCYLIRWETNVTSLCIFHFLDCSNWKRKDAVTSTGWPPVRALYSALRMQNGQHLFLGINTVSWLGSRAWNLAHLCLIPSRLLLSCAALGKLLSLSEPWLSLLYNSDDTHFIRVLQTTEINVVWLWMVSTKPGTVSMQ